MRAHTHTFYDYIICEQPVQLNGKNVCVLLALLHWVTVSNLRVLFIIPSKVELNEIKCMKVLILGTR